MDTSFSTPLELLFVLRTSDQPINCEGDHPVNIPTKFVLCTSDLPINCEGDHPFLLSLLLSGKMDSEKKTMADNEDGRQVMAISHLSVS